MSRHVVRELGKLLLILGMLIIGIGLVGIYLKEGVLGIQAALDPLNVWNYIATILPLAPGLLLIALANWKKKISLRINTTLRVIKRSTNP